MPTDPSPVFDTMTSLGVQSATLAALVWFGRRFIALHESLLGRIDAVIAETRATREAMERARETFAAGAPAVTATPPTAARRPRAGRRVGVVALVTLLLPLAAGCSGLPASWLEADRATYDAIAPEYLRYTGDDPLLSEEAKALRRMVVETWRIRLAAASGE